MCLAQSSSVNFTSNATSKVDTARFARVHRENCVTMQHTWQHASSLILHNFNKQRNLALQPCSFKGSIAVLVDRSRYRGDQAVLLHCDVLPPLGSGEVVDLSNCIGRQEAAPQPPPIRHLDHHIHASSLGLGRLRDELVPRFLNGGLRLLLPGILFSCCFLGLKFHLDPACLFLLCSLAGGLLLLLLLEGLLQLLLLVDAQALLVLTILLLPQQGPLPRILLILCPPNRCCY
mmetsp:Transcript_146292/g.364826  ORF Transcript_146292/g.364826 Transcript_146292/m.364826 type:complete len:232 (+) Transcript_146292:46-741(+)